MDPNQTYLDMFAAMRDGDHATARELALALKEWFARGGFYPYQYTPEAMHAYINSVLRRTVYLTFDDSQNRKELAMYYVICPTCGAQVEVPSNAVGPDREDLYNVVSCDECDSGFDYDDEDVMSESDSQAD